MFAWDTGTIFLGPGVALTHTSKTLSVFLQKGGIELGFFPQYNGICSVVLMRIIPFSLIVGQSS